MIKEKIVLATEETKDGQIKILSYASKGKAPVEERCLLCLNFYDRMIPMYTDAWYEDSDGDIFHQERLLIQTGKQGRCPDCVGRIIFRVSRMPERSWDDD